MQRGAICGQGCSWLWVCHCVVLKEKCCCRSAKVAIKESLMILPLVNPTSTFFVGLPFGFIWRRALALVGGDDHDDDGDEDED